MHVVADALTSLFAIFALLAGKFLGLVWMDPLMGVVGALMVARWSWGLLQDTSDVLLDRQASAKLCQAVTEAIEHETDDRVADLHVWCIGPGVYTAALSIVSDNPRPADHYKQLLASCAGLEHTTIEVHQCRH